MHPLRKIISNSDLMKSLAKEYGTPLYIYDADRIKNNVLVLEKGLSKYFHKFHICYAIKSNSNPHLLKTMIEAHSKIGGDCSSPGDIHAAELSGMKLSDCIYTGNYESESDLVEALEKGCNINLDDETSLDRLLKIKCPERISFRLNPGFGKGTFSQITTAGKEAKFGIPTEKIIQAYKKAKKAGIKKFGIQCMVGSGNLDQAHFIEVLTAIMDQTKSIESETNIVFDFISMGGGFGIPYRDEEKPINFDQLFLALSEVYYNTFPDKENAPALWIEPGKSIIGDSGFILSSVTGTKNSYKNFIGIDAGMETLMRPALYGAYHRIYKVDNHDLDKDTFDFTGQICENTDRIAVQRSFPEVNEGDLITIMDSGAYGYSMSNNFNTRPRAAEVLLNNDNVKLIRKRETINDLFTHCNV